MSLSKASYISRVKRSAIKTWIASANRLRDIAAKANADVFLTVRGLYDQEKEKAACLKHVNQAILIPM